MGGADLYVGATGYYYTDNFDSDYEELNFGIAMGPIAIDFADGQYDGSTIKDYTYTVSYTHLTLPTNREV